MLTQTDDPRRHEILKVARRHFMTEGYASTGMETVARQAGVSTATLYFHFPGKAELFSQVIDEAANDFSRQMTRVRVDGGAPRDQLVAFALAYAGFMSDPFVRSVFRLVMAERRRFKSTASRFFEKGRSEFGAVLMNLLGRLKREGHLGVAKPSWAAGQLMGMIEHPIFFVPLITGDEVQAARSVEVIAEDAVDTFLARYGVS